jgi:hypothetical protein
LTRTVCEHSLQVKVTTFLLLGALLIVYIMPEHTLPFSARCDRNHFRVTLVLEKGHVPNVLESLSSTQRLNRYEPGIITRAEKNVLVSGMPQVQNYSGCFGP